MMFLVPFCVQYGRGLSPPPSSQQTAPGGAAAAAHRDSDEDSDPELQQLYVQSYACQVFRDDPAATAVQDGAHLRPLTVPQVRGLGQSTPQYPTWRLKTIIYP